MMKEKLRFVETWRKKVLRMHEYNCKCLRSSIFIVQLNHAHLLLKTMKLFKCDLHNRIAKQLFNQGNKRFRLGFTKNKMDLRENLSGALSRALFFNSSHDITKTKHSWQSFSLWNTPTKWGVNSKTCKMAQFRLAKFRAWFWNQSLSILKFGKAMQQTNGPLAWMAQEP